MHIKYLKLVNTHINSIYTTIPIFGCSGSGQNNNCVPIDTTDDPDTPGHCPGGGGYFGVKRIEMTIGNSRKLP